MPTRIKTGLPNIEFEVADGNYDTSRATIDRIIIHTTVSSAQGAMSHFDDPNAKVSAHYIVGLDGKIYHGLEESSTAYHAGDYSMNQRSIGIEHEDGGDYNGTRPDALYTTSAKLVRDICKFYAIPIDRQHIFKHSEVSDAPTGCPDSLDIDRIVKEAAGATSPTPAPTQNGTYVDKATFETLVSKSTAFDAFVVAGYKTALDVQTALKSKQDTITNLNQTLSDRANDIIKLNAEVGTLQKQFEASEQSVATLQPVAAQVPGLKDQLAQAEQDASIARGSNVIAQKTIATLQGQVNVIKNGKFIDKLKFLYS